MSAAADQEQQRRLLAAAIKRRERLQRQLAFDPEHPETRPNEKQKLVLESFGKYKQYWIRAGNQSGKSQTCARLLTWVLTESHPTWTKPARWADEPLLIVVCGRTGKQIEDSLLKKIVSYLEPGTYKIIRIGNIVQKLEILEGPGKGSAVIFQSLENPNTARERLQSYVAHLCWIDELPPTLDLIREILVRTQARDGYNLFSFTPTVTAVAIQRFVDALKEPEALVVRMSMLDNPLYSDPGRRADLLARYATMPAAVKKAIFEGDWLAADSAVYQFDYDSMVRPLPQTYHTGWRHLEAVDPALKSALGLTLWAEDPQTGHWYCLLAEKVRGIYVPTELVDHVARRVQGRHIMRRVSDPHEVWYIQTAHSKGISYIGVNKGGRKGELIKNLQNALGSRLFLTPGCSELIEELQDCRWADQAEGKIVNGSSYHLLDSSQYACDLLPPWHGVPELGKAPHQWLYEANERRKQAVEKQQAAVSRGRVNRRRR